MSTMKSGIVSRTFRRSDTGQIVRLNQTIEGEGSYIDELARNRLVRLTKVLDGAPEAKGKSKPASDALTTSSVSPAGQASPEKTASESGDGESDPPKKAKKAKKSKAGGEE